MGIKNKILGPHFIITYPWALFSPFFIHRRLLYRSIKKHSNLLSGDILDFGCGSKPYQSLFKSNRYLGIDIENPGHSHKNEMIDVIFDGVHIPFPDKSYDACLASEVLEHVLEPDKVLNEIHRVLKKDGIVFFTTPFVWDEHEAPFDFYRYTSFGLKKLVAKNGFEILGYEKTGNFYELILQLLMIKLNRALSYLKITRIIFILSICPVINLMSLAWSRMPKMSNSLYLGHILVGKKIPKANE